MVGTEVGGYRIGEKIGEGSLGVVYKAVRTLLDRDVAIKVLHAELVSQPDFLDGARRGIRASANLNHPNIARCFDFLMEGSTALIAMEYVDGETFEQLIAQCGPMPAQDAIALFQQALHAIEFAHRQGVLHGDIRPANLMLNHRGIVKVMDFGFAKTLHSPNRTLDVQSDIYSLGATLYQMLTAREPTETPAQMVPEIPKYVESAVMKALGTDPDVRFQSVEEFGVALRPLEGPYPGTAVGSGPRFNQIETPPEPEQHLSVFGVIARGIEDIGSWFHSSRGEDESKPLQTPELPGDRIDRVHFSVTAPQFLPPARSSEVYVWAHLDEDRAAIIQRAREAIGQPITVKSKGPVALARGVTLTVALRIDGLTIENPEETILWDGEIGNANFIVTVPHDAAGERKGSATFYAHGLQIARLNFVLEIGASSASPMALNLREQRFNKAFASYASPDRDEVLARIQGIQKAAPGLEIFLDVLSLRSGQQWETELRERIPANDVFYLFWSANAKNSEWVEKEWRCALQTRGLEFIDPVPLVAPELAPPPAELSSRHFNDWVLAFRRKPQ